MFYKLTKIYQDNFASISIPSDFAHDLSTQFMRAMNDDTIDDVDLNPHYEDAQNYVYDCLLRIKQKYIEDRRFDRPEVNNDEGTDFNLVYSNARCESFFATLKIENVSLQSMSRSIFEAKVMFIFNKTFDWLVSKDEDEMNALLSVAYSKRKKTRAEFLREYEKQTNEIYAKRYQF